MQLEKTGYCPYCSNHADLYQLPNGEWACKVNLCHSMWERLLNKPLEFKLKDY